MPCRHLGGTSFAASAAELRRRRFHRIDFLDFLAGRDPHDSDGVADHVGGAFLALAPRGMGLALGPSNERLELLIKRGYWR